MITDNQVTKIVEAVFASQDSIESGRVTYLRTLLAAVQEDLPKGSDPKVQTLRLGTIHDRFYAIALATVEVHVPKGTKGRAVEMHRRVNFTRTAASALRGHVKAGGDLATLDASTVTKGKLKKRPTPQARAPSAKRALARAERESKALLSSLMALGEADKAAAVDEIQLIIGQLSQQLTELGAGIPKVPRGHRMQPSASQVIRATARPS